MPGARKTCNSPDCDRTSVCAGLCHKHYMASKRAQGHYGAKRPTMREENGYSRERRLESLLSLCDGFLHTVNALSDRACRKLGQTRSAEAQRLYELALTLRARIAKELRTSPAEPGTSGDWPPREFLSRNGYKVSAKHGAS